MTRAQRNRRRAKNSTLPTFDAKAIARLASSHTTCSNDPAFAPIQGDRVYIKRGVTQLGGHAGTVLSTCHKHGGLQLTVRVDPRGFVAMRPVNVSLADVIMLDEGMNRPQAQAHDINETAYASWRG